MPAEPTGGPPSGACRRSGRPGASTRGTARRPARSPPAGAAGARCCADQGDVAAGPDERLGASTQCVGPVLVVPGAFQPRQQPCVPVPERLPRARVERRTLTTSHGVPPVPPPGRRTETDGDTPAGRGSGRLHRHQPSSGGDHVVCVVGQQRGSRSRRPGRGDRSARSAGPPSLSRSTTTRAPGRRLVGSSTGHALHPAAAHRVGRRVPRVSVDHAEGVPPRHNAWPSSGPGGVGDGGAVRVAGVLG